MYNCYLEILLICLKMGHSYSGTKLMRHEIESFIISMNFYRGAISNPSAANMNFLGWNYTLEHLAGHMANDCYFIPESPPGSNYDVISEVVTAEEPFVISDFFESLYIYGKYFYNFSSTKECIQSPGDHRMCHYFKMVYASYRSFACNFAYCIKYGNRIHVCMQNCISIVCLFTPSSEGNAFRGNDYDMQLKPYKEGPPCSQCFSNLGLCISRLCRPQPPCEDIPDCDDVFVSTCMCNLGLRRCCTSILHIFMALILRIDFIETFTNIFEITNVKAI